jgi:hypothetical protein
MSYRVSLSSDYEEPVKSKSLGILLLIIVVTLGAVGILLGSTILGAFFSLTTPLASNLGISPTATNLIMNTIPTDSFIAFYIFIGGLVGLAVYGILKIIFSL